MIRKTKSLPIEDRDSTVRRKLIRSNTHISQLWEDSSKSPVYYNWRSSLPINWNEISSRPLKRTHGRTGTRTTLDFLFETQKYIRTITQGYNPNQPQPKSHSRFHIPVTSSLRHLNSSGTESITSFWRTETSTHKPGEKGWKLAYRSLVLKKKVPKSPIIVKKQEFIRPGWKDAEKSEI